MATTTCTTFTSFTEFSMLTYTPAFSSLYVPAQSEEQMGAVSC